MRAGLARISIGLATVLVAISTLNANNAAWAKQDRDARVKTPPQASYPTLATWFRIEGYCEVHFAIDEDGHPFAVEPACTHKVFCFDAKRAVIGASFHPKLEDGVPTIRTNVVYPMEYFFSGTGYDSEADRINLEPCENKTVA